MHLKSPIEMVYQPQQNSKTSSNDFSETLSLARDHADEIKMLMEIHWLENQKNTRVTQGA